MSTFDLVTDRPVSLPPGFKASADTAGLKPSGAPDLALVAAEAGVPCAGVFTQSALRAGPVRYCQERLQSGRARAVFTNSGVANACTGETGYRDAEDLAEATAMVLMCDPDEVLVCSTGIIGPRMDMGVLRNHVAPLVNSLRSDGFDAAATAIHTTDTRQKDVWLTLHLGAVEARLVGMCKGAAMIAPNMATMLAYLFTDAAVESAALQAALDRAVRDTFNAITVDGDTSTNDTVLVFANGAAGNEPITEDAPHFEPFVDALHAACESLARQIVQDAEGATKLIELHVGGAPTDEAARLIAASIANSPLVKTALHGADPNYGRLLMAIGKAGVPVDEAHIGIQCGEAPLMQCGKIVEFNEAVVRAYLEKSEVCFRIIVGNGPGVARMLTCDLSAEYVRLNSAYTT